MNMKPLSLIYPLAMLVLLYLVQATCKELAFRGFILNGLRRSLMTQILQHERIKTTKAKAQFVRSDLEKLITLAKHGLKANSEDTPAGKARFVPAEVVRR